MKKFILSFFAVLSMVASWSQNIDIYGVWKPIENSEYTLNISKYGTFKAVKEYSENSYLFSMDGAVLKLRNDYGADRGKMRVVVTGEGDDRVLEVYDNTNYAGMYRIKKVGEVDTTSNVLFRNSSRYGGNPGVGGSGWGLSGRSNLGLPKPPSRNRKDGKIIVKIWVDRSGNVTQAEAPVRGSTILDSGMVEEAKSTAMKAKFSASESAPELQTGTITYVYTMQ